VRRGAFTSFFDFVMRVDKAHVNRRTVESLIKSGAFDTLHPNRASLLASVDVALQAANHAAEHAHQNNLFDAEETMGEQWQAELENVPMWTLREKLAQEKLALGFYLSGHLFDEYEARSAQNRTHQTGKLTPEIRFGDDYRHHHLGAYTNFRARQTHVYYFGRQVRAFGAYDFC
jgi:DNA polymerase-3 subunit alpha